VEAADYQDPSHHKNSWKYHTFLSLSIKAIISSSELLFESLFLRLIKLHPKNEVKSQACHNKYHEQLRDSRLECLVTNEAQVLANARHDAVGDEACVDHLDYRPIKQSLLKVVSFFFQVRVFFSQALE